MAGHGPAPKDPTARRRANAPARGEWAAAPGEGWQHGPVPPCPAGVTKPTQDAWRTWFTSWYAAHWSPADLPQLRQLAHIFDAVARGDYVRATELRLWLDTWGISPKGQQDRRWVAPKPAEEAPAASSAAGPNAQEAPVPISRYEHLRAGGGQP